MSVVSRALSSLPGVGKALVGEIPVGGQSTGIDLRLPRERDPSRVVGDGQGTSIVQLAINWFINAFPEATPEVTAPDAVSRVRLAIDDHELVELLEAPNDYYGGDELFAGCIVSDIVDGNAYILKLRNGSGRIAELWWIPHTLIEPKGSTQINGPFIEYYEYRVSGQRYEIPVEEIVHIRHGLDPSNPRKGMSRLKGQLREIMTDEEAARFSAALVQNMGVPGLIISPKTDADRDLDEPAANLIKAKLDQGVGGSNRGRTVVLSGATDLHEFGFSPEQMDMSSLRGVPEERLSAAIGVPAAVLGLGTGLSQTKVGATMKELREMAAEQGLVPLWRRFGKAIHRQLMWEYQTPSSQFRFGFDTSDVRVLQEDKQKKHERTDKDVQAGILDVASAQGVLGYEVDETQRVYLRSGLLVERPVDTVIAPFDESKSWEMKLTSSQRAGLGFVRFLDKGRAPVEANYAKALETAFDVLGQAAAAGFRKLPVSEWDALDDPEAKISKSDAVKSARYKKIVNAIMQDIAAVKFDIATIADGVYQQSAELVVNGYLDAFDITLTIGERDLVAEEILKAGGKRVGLTDLSKQTKDSLFRALAEAKSEGLGMPQTARRIRDEVGAGPYSGAGAKYRAETIARTETRWAVNRSVAEVGKAAGFKKYVAFDDRIGFGDADCVARDGLESDYAAMVGTDDHPRGTLSWSPVPRSGPSAGQRAGGSR